MRLVGDSTSMHGQQATVQTAEKTMTAGRLLRKHECCLQNFCMNFINDPAHGRPCPSVAIYMMDVCALECTKFVFSRGSTAPDPTG